MSDNQISARKMRMCYEITVARVVYNSVSLAAMDLGLSTPTILKRCRSNQLKWADWKITRNPLHNAHRYAAQQVQVGNKVYASAGIAAKELKIGRTTIFYRAKNKVVVDGVMYRLLPFSKD